ncbi:MAG: MazG-like family protein [Alphaproteobacteria bacterium]|nr:MazG-like family protein [Alphaproteobacteria bacterium]
MREANVARHRAECADWSIADWMMALVGEVGEAANILKKIRRGDMTFHDVGQDLADELADVQIYLDQLALCLDIDLGAATVSKFNRTSERWGSEVRLKPSESDLELQKGLAAVIDQNTELLVLLDQLKDVSDVQAAQLEAALVETHPEDVEEIGQTQAIEWLVSAWLKLEPERRKALLDATRPPATTVAEA